MSERKDEFVYETAEPASYHLLKQLAQENKLFMTDAEQALWHMLKGNGIGHKFRQQQIIGDYIADFVNLHYKLVVEVDGKYHFKGEQPVRDELHTADLNRMGYTVVRFTNEEVLGNINKVAWQLKDIIRHMEISYPKKPETTAGKTSHTLSQPTAAGPVAAPSPFGEGWGEAVLRNAWAVDAACSGNPGPMEYQAIDLQTGERVFHFGPMQGTNNIGEFLAIVHALALLEKQGMHDKVIYSDSYNAILWVNKKQCKTKLARNAQTEPVFQIIARAEAWLRTHPLRTPIIKWETKKWGEVPADFGRKSR